MIQKIRIFEGKSSRMKYSGPSKKRLPIQELLQGEYLRITQFHQDLHDLSVVPHRHDHYEMILVTAGSGTHSINFKSYEIRPDRLYFIHKGQVHLIEPYHRDGFLIMFGDELINRFFQIHRHENEYGLLDSYTQHPYIELNESLKRAFLFIISELRRQLDMPRPDVNIMLHYVSVLLLQANKEQIVQHQKTPVSIQNRHLFHTLKEHLEKDFTRQHAAAFYAQALNCDIKKINRISRDMTGNTVFELIQERLLTEAKIRLQTSGSSIKEISYELGFNDPSFFGRFFKKQTGQTPAQFRNTRIL